jgi:hypothetical protein
MGGNGSDTLSLIEQIKPLYVQFFALLRKNASLELDVKDLSAAQIRIAGKADQDIEATKASVRKMSDRKAQLLETMTQNNLEMDRIRLSLLEISPGDPFVKREEIFKLDGVGKNSGLHALDFHRNQIEDLRRLSETIATMGFADEPPSLIRGPIDPCWCQGCTSCTGCTTLCEASCGNCIGCTGCTGCTGCGDVCSTCFGVSASQPKIGADS